MPKLDRKLTVRYVRQKWAILARRAYEYYLRDGRGALVLEIIGDDPPTGAWVTPAALEKIHHSKGVKLPYESLIKRFLDRYDPETEAVIFVVGDEDLLVFTSVTDGDMDTPKAIYEVFHAADKDD